MEIRWVFSQPDFRRYYLGCHFLDLSASGHAFLVDLIGAKLRERLAERLRAGLLGLPGVSLNGSRTQRIPHTLNLCIEAKGFNSAALASELALSTTSACNSASNAASHVLLALGLDEALARKSVRISLGRFTTEAEVDKAVEVFSRVVTAASQALW